MVESTDAGKRDDLPHFRRLHRPRNRRVLPESKMGSIFVEVVHVSSDHAPKLVLADCNHMIQAVAA
jgi:hypothetical protein